MKQVIYPGTFDPITLGHVDLVKRALRLFDKVVIAVADSRQKNTLFTLEERIKLVRQVFANNKNVTVCAFAGLLVDLAREQKIMAVLRGLRAISDFEYELQLANLNSVMEPKIDTVFLTPSEKYAYISASMVREIAALGGDVTYFVPAVVKRALQRKLKIKK